MRERISISLPTELEADLDLFAEAEGVSRGEIACAALREYLFLRRFRSLRRELVPYSEAAGFYTDEDVFRGLS
jgi:metal-responsive CopG/Arc/MetJ family transcriptional regulator